MTHVTCRLTAKNRDQLQLQNPTLGNRVRATFFPMQYDKVSRLNKYLFTVNNTILSVSLPFSSSSQVEQRCVQGVATSWLLLIREENVDVAEFHL